MRRAVELTTLAASVVLLATSCRKPVAATAPWKVEKSVESAGVKATFRLSTTTAVPGDRIDCELDVRSPLASRVTPPAWKPAGLEPVDAAELPVRLDDQGRELRQWHWTFQAGAPGSISGEAISLEFTMDEKPHKLVIDIPDIVVSSTFAPGKPADTLPPVEEHHAF